MTLDKIKKRDGRVVDFDKNKIEKAIWYAAKSVGGEDREKSEMLADKVVDYLEGSLEEGETPKVEQVQDAVEKTLVENGHYKTAKAYILYRKKHKDIRDFKKLITDISTVEDYIEESDWRVKENSNMSYSLQGLNVHVTDKVIRNYWLEKIYSKPVADAHLSGDFHIHDLGTLGPYCVGWDLKDFLKNGFRGVRGKIQSKPPKHFQVASLQLVNNLYTLQGEAAGAQAVSNFDTLMAAFVRYDDLSYEEVKQQMQEFVYNMNVPTRVGFQTPFTNITIDLEPPEYMEDEKAIVGGEKQDFTYGELQEEMNMINRAFAEVMMEGDARGRPFTFPIPTYNITKDFDWDREVLDPVWEMTAKYGIPYFSNFVNSDMKPDDARSMCCRLRLDNRELKKRGGSLFASNPLTGSIGVVTINMPRVAYEAEDEDEFFELLEERMDLAKKSLVNKREVLERLTEQGLYPYSRYYLRKIKEGYGEYWKNHFSTIGLMGMNDALLNLLDTNIATKEGRDFSVKVLEFMRGKLADYQEETGQIYNLEATPGESTCYRLAKLDLERYPDIRIYNKEKYNGESGSPYYTNSTQLPVGLTNDMFEALELQDPLQSLYTGGTVFHGFLGESMPSKEATKKLVKKIADEYHLPYYTLTPTFSVCPKHGYISGEHEYCPKCDREMGYNRGE